MVAQAFQPVRIIEAGETPALRIFHFLGVGHRSMSNCHEKLRNKSELVGRPSLAACRMAGTEARPTVLFIA
jgi:hypothetical protein